MLLHTIGHRLQLHILPDFVPKRGNGVYCYKREQIAVRSKEVEPDIFGT